jgi:hypothetical protein
MFFEIANSRAVLAMFNNCKIEWSATVDRVFPEENRDNYQYVITDKFNRSSRRIRLNSNSPASIASSMHEAEYDIIRDDIGYCKLVGKGFFNSIRSNSSKFKSPSEFNSSKDMFSNRDQMSQRANALNMLRQSSDKLNVSPAKTCTGWFNNKKQNFMFAPEVTSVKSTSIIKQLPEIDHRKNKILQRNNSKQNRSRIRPTCDTPKFIDADIRVIDSPNSFFQKRKDFKLKITQPDDNDQTTDEILRAQTGQHVVSFHNDL